MLNAAGCGKPVNKTKTETGKTEKPLSTEAKLVGSYEEKRDGKTFKHFYLDNGKGESYRKIEEDSDWGWKIVKNEVHLKVKKSHLKDAPNSEQPYMVCRVETNGDLTQIGFIVGEKRIDIPKDNQETMKIIHPSF